MKRSEEKRKEKKRRRGWVGKSRKIRYKSYLNGLNIFTFKFWLNAQKIAIHIIVFRANFETLRFSTFRLLFIFENPWKWPRKESFFKFISMDKCQ